MPDGKPLPNRYLILTTLGNKPVTLIGLLHSRDTDLMMGAFEALGIRCDVDSVTSITITVTPPISGRLHGSINVFCGLAGMVMCLAPGLALFADDPANFDGDEQIYARLMKPVLDGLKQLGATIDYRGEVGRLSFTITLPAILPSAQAQVSIDSSSLPQFISGLLLINSKLPSGLHLTHMGKKIPSLPRIRMTVTDVAGAGGTVEADESTCIRTVEPRATQLLNKMTVEPDLPNVASFLGATLIASDTTQVSH